MYRLIGLLCAALLFEACSDGGGGGSANTAPQINTTITCLTQVGERVIRNGRRYRVVAKTATVITLREESSSSGGGTGGTAGGTAVDIDVDCPDDSGNVVPAGPPA